MKVRAQLAMVMNLDKCLGCHTCSVTCKNVWTNRRGAEYMWFNDVETKPGIGYPRGWEDQERWRGGWKLDDGELKLRAGGRVEKFGRIFANPDLPQIHDYYEPWTYDYGKLTDAPAGDRQPRVGARSQLTGKPTTPSWGPNWEDDLAGAPATAGGDPNLRGIEEQVRLEYEHAFLIYLPRTCEHCLNPACVASCPSGAMYKRVEDGIVLVDQDACRGWRYCVTGCPYKKTYFNWERGKAEKCTFCYPRVEQGQPTVCAETCVGRIRYLGVLLYDADRVEEVASTPEERELYAAQLSLFLDPHDPEVVEAARRDGVPEASIEAAARSPIWPLAVEWQVALPLHPEWRTLPMVWYVPPLSPVAAAAGDGDGVFAAIEELRIPLDYLASLFTAGDPEPVRRALTRLAAMRAAMRESQLGGVDPPADVERMYRLLAAAKFRDRFVVPEALRA
ncbi:MAG: nitrate reductase subunit beta [Gaiellaceae bacterium]